MKNFILFSFLLAFGSLHGQLAPDFTVTDSDGIVHELYADHLDQGQTVVLKLFFTTCPPCNSTAPQVQQMYEDWEEGAYDVEFIELSTSASDTDSKVNNYKNQHGITFPGVSAQGGSTDAVIPYKSGTFGPYWGTPTLVVVAPNGEVTMGFDWTEIDDVIAATGATGMDGGSGEPDPTGVSLSSSTTSNSSPIDLKYYLKPENADSPKFDILDLTGGSLTFEYPSVLFPEIENPIIIVEATGLPADESINPVDLVGLRKHMLELDPLTDEAKLLAADVNSDGKINPVDLTNLTKAILELITEFPNDTPSWKTIPAFISLEENPGGTVSLEFQLVKIGDVR